MTKIDSISLGPCPAEEECTQLGTVGYETIAKSECERFIDLIRSKCGKEPPGAKLIVKGCPHDFGTYYEVYVRFDTDDSQATEYAFMLDREVPQSWEDFER